MLTLLALPAPNVVLIFKVKYNEHSYTHVKKTLTIRNSKILLEQDFFKKMEKQDNGLGYIYLTVKYYYNYNGSGKDKVFWISKKILKENGVKYDTIYKG